LPAGERSSVAEGVLNSFSKPFSAPAAAALHANVDGINLDPYKEFRNRDRFSDRLLALFSTGSGGEFRALIL